MTVIYGLGFLISDSHFHRDLPLALSHPSPGCSRAREEYAKLLFAKATGKGREVALEGEDSSPRPNIGAARRRRRKRRGDLAKGVMDHPIVLRTQASTHTHESGADVC